MKQKSIKLNFIMNMILNLSSFIFPLITFPYVSRVLLPVGTGKVSFVTSVITYFTMFAQLGIPTYGVRACARVRDNREELTRTAHELLAVNLAMALFSYLVLFLALAVVPRFQDDRSLYLIISLTIVLNAIGMEWLYRALEQYTYITVRSIAFKFVALIAMFLLVHEKQDYVIYGGITILAGSASNIFNLINVHKYIDLKPVGRYRPMRHMKAVLIFFAMACATTIYTHLDSVMLGFIKTDTDVGYYNAAVKIKTILVSIVSSLGTVLLPRASYYVDHGNMNEFRRIAGKALNFVFLFATPLMIYFILYARQGIFFLSGDAYAGSIVPMQIIMPTVLLIGLTNTLGIQILVPLGREKVVLYSEIAGAAVDLALNMMLIPRYGAAGAAAGTVAAESAVFLVQLFSLRGENVWLFRGIAYGKMIAAIAASMLTVGFSRYLLVTYAASFLAAETTAVYFCELALSASVFFLTYLAVLLLTRETMTREILQTVANKIRRR